MAVSVLMLFVFIFPLASITTANQTLLFTSCGIEGLKEGDPMILSSWPISIIVLLTMIFSFFTIFLYRKRMIQIRLTIFNTVLLLGLIGLLYYYIGIKTQDLNGTINYKLVCTFPLIGAILNFLALRGIGKDEARIRALDRIR